MSENLPAVRTEAPVVARDTDSWAQQLPAVVDLSRAIANTDFVPESLRNNVAATTAAILYGREIGLAPMTALNNVNVINGRPGLSAAIMRAQVLAAGHEIQQVEANNGRCVLRGRRRGTDYWQTVEYSIDDARAAGLLGRKNQMYEKHPRRMLRARATTELCELMFADVIRGMPSLEELEDLEDQPGTPAPTTRAKVQRKTRATTPQTDDGAAPLSGTDSSPAAAPSSPPLPPLPGEPGYDSVSGIAEQGSSTARGTAVLAGPDSDGILPLTDPDAEAAPAADRDAEDKALPASASGTTSDDGVKMNTRAQQRGLFALFKAIGIVDDAERMQVTADLIGRMPRDGKTGKPSWNGLTWDEASWMTTAMSTAKNRDHVEALIELAEQQRSGGEQG